MKNSKYLIIIYGLFISICVSAVMFFIYNPNQNSLAALSSVCMDIICMIILLIMIGSFAFDNYGSKRTTRLFSGLLAATIWALFLDFLNWAFDGSLEFGHLTFWFTVGSLCMGAVLATIFSLYLYSYMDENHNLSKMKISAYVCVVLNIISFILTFILAISGTAFQFVDGHYETGMLYDVVTVLPVLTLLYLTFFSNLHVKKIGIHDAVAVTGYILFMIAGALIEATYGIGTTYVAVAIADFFIFVMLQNAILAEEKRIVKEWMIRSNTDELTGLYNRHAYEDDIREIEKEELTTDLVYYSIDVNSLKMVNDTYGHSAGDELIVGTADCLRKSVGAYGKLYRIGGDEFVAIIHADANQLGKVQRSIDDATAKWRGELVECLTISCGYATSIETEKMTIKQMAGLADHRMYEAKSKYYRYNGIDRRRK